jgi:hypothetical protein
MSQTFQITWVGDRTRDWETDKGQFTEYKVALAGYDPSENDPEAGKTVAWSRRKDAQAPRPGDEVFGHVEAKQYDWGTKYVFKTDQAQSGGPPPSFKKAGANGAGAPANQNAVQDSDWWYAKDRRISRAGVLQAVVASEGLSLKQALAEDQLDFYVAAVNRVTDALLASLDERTPHPSAPKEEDMTVAQPPAYEDVTPSRADAVRAATDKVKTSAPSGVGDDDDIPF